MSNYNYCILDTPSNDNSLLSFFSTLNLFVFYGLFLYSFKKIINSHYENNKLTIAYYFSDIIKSKNETHNDNYKNELFNNLLSLNSLNRCYILYFIFKRKGDFKTLIMNNKTKKEELTTYNTYNLFTKVKDNYNLSADEFNLDESQPIDTIVTIGNEKHYLTLAQLKFIQWIYYTDIYDYLLNNNDIKYDILNEMNEKHLLDGNLFLRYHLFLCDYEFEKENSNKSNNNNNNDSDDSDDTVIDDTNTDTNDNSNTNSDDNSDDDTNTNSDNNSDDNSDENNNNNNTDTDTDTDIDNDNELNKYNMLIDTINFTDILKNETYKELNKIKNMINNFI